MEREWLEARLAAGMSLEAMAQEAGKGVSTVGYWVKKHGLVAAGSERHRAKGGLSEARLRELVDRGWSQRQIAAEVDRSLGSVRHWLRQYGLQTVQRSRRREDPSPSMTRRCEVHGEVEFRVYEGYRLRCPRCVADAVSEARRRRKTELVTTAGGACAICRYDRCAAALHFHHVDPSTKAFALGSAGVTRARAVMEAEAGKCVLLCANCHAEVEAGLAQLPFAPVAAD